MGHAGQASGVPAMLARAHHGWVSREQRLEHGDATLVASPRGTDPRRPGFDRANGLV